MDSRLAIVGGGPAGMMAAIRAAEVLGGSRVVLFDKNDRLGRKIYLTGKGRCNLTNMRPWEDFAGHIHPNQAFLKAAFRAFSNEAVRRFFAELGVPTVVQQGQRVYPASLTAGDVARALERRVQELGVDIRCGTTVESLTALSQYGAVIVATGGKSYPVTGSTGDGYRMAEEAGHKVTQTFPSETALMPRGYDPTLAGLTLKNVGLQLRVDRSVVQREQGEFNFTEDGLESGIAYLLSRRAVHALVNGQQVELLLDLKPALSPETLAARIARETQNAPEHKPERSLLRRLMPEALIPPFLQAHPDLTIGRLPERLKNWTFRIVSHKGYERAVVTAGGVSLKEIVPKTMASRLHPGLYFCGEVLDLDGDTGGYNLQIAFSTGAAAGTAAARYLLSLP